MPAVLFVVWPRMREVVDFRRESLGIPRDSEGVRVVSSVVHTLSYVHELRASRVSGSATAPTETEVVQ
jgi:hypothetical protein